MSSHLEFDDAAPANMNDHAQHDSLGRLCDALAAQVHAFLDSEPESELLKAVQQQTRIALGVIDTALERYTCVVPLMSLRLCLVQTPAG